jgi:NTP pyrophosphatase (non-canonical NTP hydrolase)
MIDINEKLREILLITQEECAEVTQAISKVFRFGMDDVYPVKDGNPTNRENLEEELGDLLCMIILLMENEVVTKDGLKRARIKKLNKLKTWSSIFK